MSILDNENEIVEKINKRVTTSILCERLGHLYMTPSFNLGYVLSVDENGLPNVLMRVNNTSVYGYQLSEYILKCTPENGAWFIPSREEFLECVKDWNDEGDEDIIIKTLIDNSDKDRLDYEWKLNHKHQHSFLENLNDHYWLREEVPCIMYMGKFFSDNKHHIRIQYIDPFDISLEHYGTISIYKVPENERWSYEDSQKLIEKQVNEMTWGKM